MKKQMVKGIVTVAGLLVTGMEIGYKLGEMKNKKVSYDLNDIHTSIDNFLYVNRYVLAGYNLPTILLDTNKQENESIVTSTIIDETVKYHYNKDRVCEVSEADYMLVLYLDNISRNVSRRRLLIEIYTLILRAAISDKYKDIPDKILQVYVRKLLQECAIIK